MWRASTTLGKAVVCTVSSLKGQNHRPSNCTNNYLKPEWAEPGIHEWMTSTVMKKISSILLSLMLMVSELSLWSMMSQLFSIMVSNYWRTPVVTQINLVEHNIFVMFNTRNQWKLYVHTGKLCLQMQVFYTLTQTEYIHNWSINAFVTLPIIKSHSYIVSLMK